MIVFWFLVKEGWRGLFRSGYAGIFSILILSISLVLIGFGYIAARDTLVFVDNIKSQFDIDVFLVRTAKITEIEQVAQEIRAMPEVSSVIFISADSAAQRFKQEFGEDIFDILDFNPLPPSFTISLKKPFRHIADIDLVAARIAKYGIVDEVKYRKQFLHLIERYQQYILITVIAVFAFLTLISVILASNSIKMTIFSRRDVIETMKLVGATNNFVRAPFMIEGTLGGLCAASLAITFIAACVYLVNNYLQTFITYRLLVSYRFYLGLVILGGVMGLIGSLRAVRKFL